MSEGSSASKRRFRYSNEEKCTLRVSNFKSISKVALNPNRLTVLAGANSSGKSSLLQAVLFLAQSVSADEIVINGELVRLGEAHEILRSGATTIGFEFEFGIPGIDGSDENRVTCYVGLQSKPGGLRTTELELRYDDAVLFRAEAADSPLKKRLGRHETALKVVNTSESLGIRGDAYLTVSGLRPSRFIYQASFEAYRSYFEDQPESQASSIQGQVLSLARTELDAPEWLADLARDFRRGDLGSDWFESLSDEQIQDLLTRSFQVEAPGGWAAVSLRSYSPAALRFVDVSESTDDVVRHGLAWVRVPLAFLADAVEHMGTFADEVLYLGPLRDEPRPAYPLGHTVSSLPVGARGQFTASYLDHSRDRSIWYNTPDGDMRRRPLPSAVSEWCNYLGIATAVEVEDSGKFGHALALTVDGNPRDLTSIGVGASQLLPVVSLVLGAEAGQIVLLEQPELHLHPQVQSRLGDFLAWAKPDVRLLVETHSEYLVTRLRRRVADGRLERHDVAVKFVEKLIRPRDDDDTDSTEELEVASVYKTLEMSDLGDFNYWPEGFFDALDDDHVAIARRISEMTAAKRRRGADDA